MTLDSGSSHEISNEIIEENKKVDSKKGGRYSKAEKDRRQKEVYRLHYDYGYTARKIAEMMNVNRNTVNADINYWYGVIFQKINIYNPEDIVVSNIQRLETQRTRLREKLDKIKSFQEYMAVERLIYEIDAKISYTYQRVTESFRSKEVYAVDRLNKVMKERHFSERFMTLHDKFSVSEKAREAINKIIEIDKINQHKIRQQTFPEYKD